MTGFQQFHYTIHETTARAARLEQGLLVTLVLPASNVHGVQGFRRDSPADSATLPRTKGRTGVVRGAT